jgi:hypothetical protein
VTTANTGYTYPATKPQKTITRSIEKKTMMKNSSAKNANNVKSATKHLPKIISL